MIARTSWLATTLPQLLLLHSHPPSFVRARDAQLPLQAASSYSSFSSDQTLKTLASTNMTRAPAVALSHGGGPMPVLGDPHHVNIINTLSNSIPKLLRLNTPEAPRAIVIVTAHWSTQKPTICSGPRPQLMYDYHGFPAEAYRLKYDAPGSPEVAQTVAAAMRAEGMDPILDEKQSASYLTNSAMESVAACRCLLTTSRMGSWRLCAHASHPSSGRYSNRPGLCARLRVALCSL